MLYVAETEDNVANTKWIESAGGPLVVIPRSAIAEWEGVAGDDYQEACGVEDYLGLLSREWGDVLVLGEEPLRTTVVRRAEGPAIVRWMYGPAEDQLLEIALNVDLDDLRPVETLYIQLRDEPYLILDSGAAGPNAETLEFVPASGPQEIRTYVVKDDTKEVGIVLHRFRPSSPYGRVGLA